MSVEFAVVFHTNSKLEDVAKYVREVCGINLGKDRDDYVGYVCGVRIILYKYEDRVTLHCISYAGLHFSSQNWALTHDFLALSVTELLCARFECNAKIVGDQNELLYEVRFNPKYKNSRNLEERCCIFEKATESEEPEVYDHEEK